MALAYKNTKFTLKHKMANKREDAVTREMMTLLADDKKMSRKEKDERWVGSRFNLVLWMKFLSVERFLGFLLGLFESWSELCYSTSISTAFER